MIIRAEIVGSSFARALGVTVTAPAPVLALCRALIREGHDPATPLEAYRGEVLCLKVRSIGEGAELGIAGDGVGFRRVAEPVAAPPVSLNREAA
jgi:hypothetical protein